MNSQLIYWFFFLVLVTGLSQSEAAEPIAEFDAARVIAKSGWTAENDKPHRAEVTTDGGALRIADEESDGQLEDAYLYLN